jgi:tRNA pseudouridine38-40 synthase
MIRRFYPRTANCPLPFSMPSPREYEYFIYQVKDPFLDDRAYYFPYTLDMAGLEAAAGIVGAYTDFTSFAKRNSQVKTFTCHIEVSEWRRNESGVVYRVKANRFFAGDGAGPGGYHVAGGTG